MVDNDNRRARERAVFDTIEQARGESRDVLLDQMTDALHANFPHYSGVYIYLLEGDTLVLGPYRGRPT